MAAAGPPAEWKVKVKRAREGGGERVTHLHLRVVEEEGGRGEEPRRAAAAGDRGRRAAEERREPPLHRLGRSGARHVTKANQRLGCQCKG